MSAYEWTFFIGAILLGLVLTWQIPSIWHGRGEDLLPYEKPVDWRWDQPTWRGVIRCRVLAGPWLLTGAAIWLSENADLGSADQILDIVGHVVAPFMLVLPLAITLLNRPKSLVPKRWRDERGALAEWFRPQPRQRNRRVTPG
jgi:hypothetical protein